MENRYKTALEIQDACNLTAIAGTLHKICLEVLHETGSIEAVRNDPAVRVIIDKINSMIPGTDWSTQYGLCEERSK